MISPSIRLPVHGKVFVATLIGAAGVAALLLTRPAISPSDKTSPEVSRDRRSASRDAHADLGRPSTPLPQTAAKVLLNGDPVWRSEHFSGLAAEVPDAELEAVLRGLDAELLETSYATILTGRWTALAPARAAAWATTLPVGPARAAILERVARIWADADPAPALVWSRGLSSPGEREQTALQVADAGVIRQPEFSLRLGLSLPDSPKRTAVLDAALHRWAELSPHDATVWALGRGESSRRGEAITVVARSMARTDLENAADLAIEELAEPNILHQALVAVMAAGRTNSPDTIREWIDSFPEGPLRDAAEAEWKRGHDLTDPPPARMPGEDLEDRTPLARP